MNVSALLFPQSSQKTSIYKVSLFRIVQSKTLRMLFIVYFRNVYYFCMKKLKEKEQITTIRGITSIEAEEAVASSLFGLNKNLNVTLE